MDSKLFTDTAFHLRDTPADFLQNTKLKTKTFTISKDILGTWVQMSLEAVLQEAQTYLIQDHLRGEIILKVPYFPQNWNSEVFFLKHNILGLYTH